jgi:nucleoside-specific outer membrane channel protein Tsx
MRFFKHRPLPDWLPTLNSVVPQSTRQGARTVLLALIVVAGNSAHAADFSTTSFLALWGDEFEFGDKSRQIFTFEHANAWKYGDNFFFFDVTNPTRDGDNTPTGFYGEYSPRLSFGKILRQDLSIGPLRDVLLASTLEMGEGFNNQLYGVGSSWDIPGFAFFNLDYFPFVNDSGFSADSLDDGQQITISWLYPINIGPVSLIFEGYLDYAFGSDDEDDNVLWDPRLLVDAGKFWGSPGHLFAGVEWRYWDNKFGNTDDIDENFPVWAIKWTF